MSFFTKTTQTILKAFTKDLQEVADRESTLASYHNAQVARHSSKSLAAIAEATAATTAITNITALFTKESTDE